LRPDSAQCRDIRTRFFIGARVYNAALGEFIERSRAVKSDPAWESARQMPHRTPAERSARARAFRAAEQAHGFTNDASKSFASALRKSWVRKHLPAQEAQNLGARAFDAVKGWHLGIRGKPRFKPVARGLRSLAGKDGNGALRPKVDADGRLVGLQWGAGFVIPIAAPAQGGRRGKEQQAELTEIEELIAAGKVLHTRIVRTVIEGRDTYRMQLMMDGPPPRRHRVGDGRVSFDLGPSTIAVAVDRNDGTWTGWVEPLADRISVDTARLRRAQRHFDRQHRAGSPECFSPDGAHKSGRCEWKRSVAAKHSATRVAELHRRLAGHRKTLHGALTNRLFTHGADIACEKLDYSAWQKSFPRSVRDRAPGMLVDTIRRKAESAGGDRLFEYATNTTALSRAAYAGTARKSRSHNGCTVANAVSESIGTCSPPTSDYTFTGTRMVSTSWIWRQPTPAGFTVRTSTGAEVPLQHQPTGEAADIRHRHGGRRRASTPGVKPRPRSDRASRHEHPPPTGLRRCPDEQRDSRTGRWNPGHNRREDVKDDK
jgi:hypothetical protein